MDNGLCLGRLMGSCRRLKLGLATAGSGMVVLGSPGIIRITYVSRNAHKIGGVGGGTCVKSQIQSQNHSQSQSRSVKHERMGMMTTRTTRMSMSMSKSMSEVVKTQLLATVSLTSQSKSITFNTSDSKSNWNSFSNSDFNSKSKAKAKASPDQKLISARTETETLITSRAKKPFVFVQKTFPSVLSSSFSSSSVPTCSSTHVFPTQVPFRSFGSNSFRFSSSASLYSTLTRTRSRTDTVISTDASWTKSNLFKRKSQQSSSFTSSTASSRKSKDFDAFGTWDSTSALPLVIDKSIAHGKPIPKVLVSSIGASSVKGRRATQEDQYGFQQLSIQSMNSSPSSSPSPAPFLPHVLYWAVFDGHGGADCSSFCAQEMPNHITYWIERKMKELEDSKELDLSAVLHNAFLDVNNAFAGWYMANRKGAEADSSGCTATVVLLQDSTRLAVGHVGDSRAILCRSGEPRKLTTDHVPSLITEKSRIEKSGGRVHNGRVNERLNMTRSIGDLELKRFGVSAEPEVRLVNINHSRDSFLVLTTDGINNVMTDKEIIETVKQAQEPSEAAHLLTDTALQYSSEDNSTAIVTPLGSWLKYSAAATIFHNFGKSFASSSRFG